MSFGAINYDFSTLPKVRAHAQLGVLGDMNQDARQALEDAHSIVIDFATAASDFYNDAVANGAPQGLIDSLQASYQDARDLVTQHTAMMNAFYAQTGISGLTGIKLGRLGQGPLPILLGLALRQIFWTSIWVYIASIIGRIADSFKSNTDAAQAKFKTCGEYYLAWRQAKDAGVTPPEAPADCNRNPAGGDMTTYLLIGGATLLAVMLLMKR